MTKQERTHAKAIERHMKRARIAKSWTGGDATAEMRYHVQEARQHNREIVYIKRDRKRRIAAYT